MNKAFAVLSLVFAGALLASVVVGNSARTTSKNIPAPDVSVKQTANLVSFQLAAARAKPPARQPIAESNNPTAVSESVIIPAPAFPNAPPPAVGAEAATVREINTSYAPLNLNTQKRWPIASLTKLMTALVALEQFNPDATATVSAHAVDTEGVAGKFNAGERYLISDLVKALLLVSSNDAAVAIEEAYDNKYGAGSFVTLMNNSAQSLSLNNTVFVDVSGLSVLNQSSVYDLSALVQFIFNKYPKIFEITQKTEGDIRELNSGKRRRLTNINRLAGDERFLGGKTGFIDESGGNLISILKYKGRPILIIVLGSDDQDGRFEDTELLYNWLISR